MRIRALYAIFIHLACATDIQPLVVARIALPAALPLLEAQRSVKTDQRARFRLPQPFASYRCDVSPTFTLSCFLGRAFQARFRGGSSTANSHPSGWTLRWPLACGVVVKVHCIPLFLWFPLVGALGALCIPIMAVGRGLSERGGGEPVVSLGLGPTRAPAVLALSMRAPVLLIRGSVADVDAVFL